MTEKNYLDVVHDACDEVRSVAYDLETLARSFRITGNNQVADDLFVCAAALHKAPKDITGAISMELHRQTKAGQEQTGLVLMAALKHAETEGELTVCKQGKRVRK